MRHRRHDAPAAGACRESFSTLWCNDWFNPEAPLSVLQCVWPDRRRRYPWDPQVDEAIRGRQPLLVEELQQGAARS